MAILKNELIYKSFDKGTGKRQGRLQLSQLEVFSRCLNAKSETISKFEYQ